METPEIDKQYLGQVLLKQGFKTWFLYMFRVIEGKPFIIEPIHNDIFEMFQDIIDGKITRANLNVPPRTAKTTLSKYLCVHTLTVNPAAKFIYTSFNQGLLTDISKDMAGIMEHPIYKAMYPNQISVQAIESQPVDEFWRNYLETTLKKNTYTNRKITTSKGGEVLFAAIGSQITGSGCGIRGAKTFSGGLIIDDANKPADIHSQNMRDKCLRYFEETLLSRLNDSNVLILNVQQRLHLEDLSGHLLRKYQYYTLRRPLLDENGVCQIPSQYTPERIEELKINESMFQAQYQQEPIAEKGLIIKRDWWRWYKQEEVPISGQLIITADTAFKQSKTADFSVIQVWELRRDRMLKRDMILGRWEFNELMQQAKEMWDKWTDPNRINKAQYLFVEDRASGSPLQQMLTLEGINAIAWTPAEYDYPDGKVERTKEASWDVFKGMIYLDEGAETSDYLLTEASLFSEDMSHSHDDACFVSTTMVQTTKGDKKICDVKVGDYVITPFGKSKVLKTHVREKQVITNIGLTGTPDHKVYCFNDYTFDKLENMEYANTSKLTFKELAKWALDLAYYSTEKSTILTQRQDITKLRIIMKQKNISATGFTGICTNFIQERKFLKVIMYTIRTAIKTITLWKTLSCYHIANMHVAMAKKLRNVGNVLKCEKQTQGGEKNVKNGIIQKKEENGTPNIKNNISQNTISQKHAQIAEKSLTRQTTTENNQCVKNAGINISKENYANVQKVYNITVEAGLYYANGILVSNCDAFTMAHSIWKYYGGGQG